MRKIFFVIFMISVFAVIGLSCTTIAVTKGASVDGSVMTSHTVDCGFCDYRYVYVPAADYEAGSQRAVYPFIPEFPRYVGIDMGPTYDIPGYIPTEPLGYIDQAEHTYAYFDGVYGVINEHQLTIGECTTSAKVYAPATPDKCIFDVSALSRVAMERCTTAKEAVQLMGDLAVKYGYYGWGETLTVVDTQEVWVFEICATPDKKSALWVAKKVPDGEVFVEANEFRIRDVLTDDLDMMYSPNLFEVTAESGWYNPGSDKPLDWLKTVSTGEYSMPYNSLRRVWRVLDRVAPSLELSPWVEDAFTRDYPFSVKPESKLSVADVMDLQRDFYEGTEFDLTKGLAAGPFGNPNRYSGGSKYVRGSWERAISMFRAQYVWVSQSRDWLPDPIGGVVWWGATSSHSTIYVPFYCGITDVPASYDTGSLEKFDRESSYWAFEFMGNWAELKFCYMYPEIKAKQAELEGNMFAKQPEIETEAVRLFEVDPALAIKYLTDYSADVSEKVLSEIWDFNEYLITKYVDGYINVPKVGTSVGYPDWWLKEVGYGRGHKFGVTGYQKPK